LKSEDFIAELKHINPDLQIVVAFRMLPEVVWNIPEKGTFNLHASLLPDYRGAAPINHAIINGDSITGLTSFFIDEKIDNGQIILQKKLNIGSDETAGELHDRMMIKGSELVLQTVKLIENNEVTTIPQSKLESNLLMRPAPKIFKEDCHIDWNKPVTSIHNLIRGLSPYPGAFALLSEDGKNDKLNVKIFHSNPIEEKNKYSPGSIITDNKNYLKVSAADGFIEIRELQMAGKKKLPTNEFLRGFNFNKEDSFC
jgi:methionyl-tRNA formyltransferase